MVVAAADARFDLVEDSGVGGIETMFADRQKLVEEGEAECMLLLSQQLAQVKMEYTRHRVLEGTKRPLQLISRETLPSVVQD